MKYAFIVMSDPVPGSEEEYNDWYSNTHLREMLKTPGFVAAQRFQTISDIADGPPHSYLAFFEIDGDLEEAKAALAAGAENRVPAPDAVARERKTWWFAAVSPRIEAEDA